MTIRRSSGFSTEVLLMMSQPSLFLDLVTFSSYFSISLLFTHLSFLFEMYYIHSHEVSCYISMCSDTVLFGWQESAVFFRTDVRMHEVKNKDRILTKHVICLCCGPIVTVLCRWNSNVKSVIEVWNYLKNWPHRKVFIKENNRTEFKATNIIAKRYRKDEKESGCHNNTLRTKRRLLYLKTQFVPRSKLFISVIKTNQFML